jgi:predicted RNA-binding protein with PIN domain
MTGAAADPVPTREPVLPEPVRLRVVALAADTLGALKAEDAPPALRPFARFTPAKRARLATTPLALALEGDARFREHVADRVREGLPDLAAALDAGAPPAAADPFDVAAAAYVLRPDGWAELVEAAAEAARQDSSSTDGTRALESVARLQDQLASTRTTAREDAKRLRAELAASRAETRELRQRLREAVEQAGKAEAATAELREAAQERRALDERAASVVDAEQRRLRARLADAESALETARRTAREGRTVDDSRLRLLLDTVLDAAAGLRRELALRPVEVRPADTVSTAVAGRPAGPAERALADDDPVRLDHLVEVPHVHLLVDGYNVTKEGYGELPLETQRRRLVGGLAALAAQTMAEVTCVFDGADLDGPVPTAAARGVRVLFSPAAVTADELIRQLVRAEPQGRPVVVVSSDREVADGVRRAGARSVPSTALLRRLARS